MGIKVEKKKKKKKKGDYILAKAPKLDLDLQNQFSVIQGEGLSYKAQWQGEIGPASVSVQCNEDSLQWLKENFKALSYWKRSFNFHSIIVEIHAPHFCFIKNNNENSWASSLNQKLMKDYFKKIIFYEILQLAECCTKDEFIQYMLQEEINFQQYYGIFRKMKKGHKIIVSVVNIYFKMK